MNLKFGSEVEKNNFGQNMDDNLSQKLNNLKQFETNVDGQMGEINNSKFRSILLPSSYIPFIPSVDKEKQANAYKINLGCMIATSEGKYMTINQAMGDIIKNEIREIRKKFHGAQLQEQYKKLNKEILNFFINYLPDKNKSDLSGIWKLKFYTIGNEPMKRESAAGGQNISRFNEQQEKPESIDLNQIDLDVLLSDIGSMLSVSALEEIDKKIMSENSEDIKKDIIKRVPSDLRLFVLKLGRAKRNNKKEDWDQIAEEYIKFMDYLPQYIEHRVAIKDLMNRHLSGEIKKFPENILSVGSGPAEEARAHMDLEPIYQEYGLKKPKVFNIDSSLSMLKLGEEAYLDRAIEKQKKDIDLFADIQADMTILPIKNGAFDMVECSSMDNFKNSEDDLEKTFAELIRVLKKDGILRVTYKGRLPDIIYDKFKKSGLKLLNEPHTVYKNNLTENIMAEKFNDARLGGKIKEKLSGKDEYILAIKEKEIPYDKMEWIKPDEEIIQAIKEQNYAKLKISRTEKRIDNIITVYNNKPQKQSNYQALNLLMEDIYSSLLADISEGIVISKEGNLILDRSFLIPDEIDKIKNFQNKGIPENILDYCDLDPQMRINLLARYSHKKFERYQFILEEKRQL